MASPSMNEDTNQDGKNMSTAINAPAMKLYWSSTGALAPRCRPNLLLMNAPVVSPSSEPTANAIMMPKAVGREPNPQSPLLSPERAAIIICNTPRAMPADIPPTRPVQVFPSPRMRFPRQERPKSIGLPPPKMTAAELGKKAGSINQKPLRATIIASIGS